MTCGHVEVGTSWQAKAEEFGIVGDGTNVLHLSLVVLDS